MDNGINAKMIHDSRTHNDNDYVHSMIENYVFAVFGVVKKYADERIDVQCGGALFTNIEVMVFGVDGWGIKPIPAVGDRVLVVSTVNPTPDLKTMAASASMPAYDASGLKAICLTDSVKATQLISVDKDKIDVTGNNKLTVNADGVKFEDKNGNKVTTSSDGVAFEDTNGNKVTTSDSGVAFEDTNGNKVTTSDSGVSFEDLNGNKVTCDDSGVAFEDTNGNKATTSSDGVAFEDKNSNKVTTDSNGIATEDKNGNKYTGTSTGTVVEAKGGCKIEMGSSSVKINGKLEILKN